MLSIGTYNTDQNCVSTVYPSNATTFDPSDVRSPKMTTSPEADGWRNPLPYSRTITSGDYRYVRLSGYGRSDCRCKPTTGLFFSSSGAFAAVCASNIGSTFASVPAAHSLNTVNKALAKLADRGLNLAVAFGERKETVSMVTDAVQTLTKAARAVRRGDFRQAARTLRCAELKTKPSKVWSDNWLAFHYGWVPLYTDIHKAVDMLRENDLQRPKRYMVSVKATEQAVTSSTQTVSNITRSGILMHAQNVKFLKEVETKQFCRLDYYLQNPELATASQLGLVNPLTVAWELTTLSFVVDWFLPIGDYLSAMTADIGWSFRGGSLSTVHDVRFSIAESGNPYWASNVCKINNSYPFWVAVAPLSGSYVYRKKSFARTVYASSPSAKFPSLEDPFSAKRLMTALALFRQAFKG